MDRKNGLNPGLTEASNNTRHKDLRDLLLRFEEIGELERIQEADWNLEMLSLIHI